MVVMAVVLLLLSIREERRQKGWTMIRARCRFLICCRDATVASWINFIHGLRTRHSYIGNSAYVSLFTLVFLLTILLFLLCFSLFLSCFLIFTLLFQCVFEFSQRDSLSLSLAQFFSRLYTETHTAAIVGNFYFLLLFGLSPRWCCWAAWKTDDREAMLLRLRAEFVYMIWSFSLSLSRVSAADARDSSACLFSFLFSSGFYVICWCWLMNESRDFCQGTSRRRLICALQAWFDGRAAQLARNECF